MNFCYFLTIAKGEYVMTVSGLSPDTNLLTRSDFSDGFSAVFLYLAAPKSLSQMWTQKPQFSPGLLLPFLVRILHPVRFLLPESRRNFGTCDVRTLEWSFPSDLLHCNVSLRASEQTHGPPARKVTRLTG